MTTSLSASNASPADPTCPASDAPPPRAAAAWARDYAIVGGVSSFLALFVVSGAMLGWATLIGTTLAGAATGAVLGTMLSGHARAGLGTLPWPLAALVFLAIGAAWGAVVGAIGGTVLAMGMDGVFGLGHHRGGFPADVHLLFMSLAAIAGAAQLAWFGVAYLWADRRGVPRWPLVLGAVGTPFLGAALLMVGGRFW